MNITQVSYFRFNGQNDWIWRSLRLLFPKSSRVNTFWLKLQILLVEAKAKKRFLLHIHYSNVYTSLSKRLLISLLSQTPYAKNFHVNEFGALKSIYDHSMMLESDIEFVWKMFKKKCDNFSNNFLNEICNEQENGDGEDLNFFSGKFPPVLYPINHHHKMNERLNLVFCAQKNIEQIIIRLTKKK